MTQRPNGSMVSNPQYLLYLLEFRAFLLIPPAMDISECCTEMAEICIKIQAVFSHDSHYCLPVPWMIKSTQIYYYSWIIQWLEWHPGKPPTLPVPSFMPLYIYLYKTPRLLTWMTFRWVLSVLCKSKQQHCFCSATEGWHLSLLSLLLCNWGSLKQQADSSLLNKAAMFHPSFTLHLVMQIQMLGFIFPLLIYIVLIPYLSEGDHMLSLEGFGWK